MDNMGQHPVPWMANTSYSASKCFKDTVNWIIMLISLAENLFTAYYFDEDKFGVITIALIFCFEPILDSCVKQLMNCTECDWDNFCYDLISEGIQCWLFIHFCDYSDLSVFLLPLMMIGQVFLLIVLKVKETCCDKNEEKNASHEDDDGALPRCFVEVHNFCVGNCFTLMTGLYPLIYLAYQEESPYRQKSFEMVLAFYYWTADIDLQYRMEAERDAADGDGNKMNNLMANTSWTVKFTTLCQIAFSVYGGVLAWMYWFSPDIEVVFPDKVFTMATMVLSCCVGIMIPCQIYRMTCGTGNPFQNDDGVAGLDNVMKVIGKMTPKIPGEDDGIDEI